MNLDEKLLEEAQRLSGVAGKTAVIHAGLRALIARESARRLAALGASAGFAALGSAVYANERRPADPLIEPEILVICLLPGVLVVDDHAISRRYIAAALRQTNWYVKQAATASVPRAVHQGSVSASASFAWACAPWAKPVRWPVAWSNE